MAFSAAHIYIWCLLQVILFLKLLSNTVLQFAARVKHDAFSYPEDQKTYGKSNLSQPIPEALTRATNLWRNDLENLIIFDFLALAAAIVQVNLFVYIGLLVIFIVARFFHAYFLMRPRQPHRTLSYNVGVLCMIFLSGMLVYRLVVISSAIS